MTRSAVAYSRGSKEGAGCDVHEEVRGVTKMVCLECGVATRLTQLSDSSTCILKVCTYYCVKDTSAKNTWTYKVKRSAW